MLGNAIFRVLTENRTLEVFGTVRSESVQQNLNISYSKNLLTGVNVEQQDSLIKTFRYVQPNVVINCIGLIKQLSCANDPLKVIPINSLLPHQLARLCELNNTRFIHMSTDCVFNGDKGDYVESDCPDAKDLYGMSKYLGEVSSPNTITIRTSIIGHELQSKHGLVDWFLAQKISCRGYRKAIFSGFPTIILAKIIADIIIPNEELHGIYHVAAKPINKFDLLNLIARTYGKVIEIIPDDSLVIDRSLNAGKFQTATGFISPDWPELIQMMYSYR